MRRHIRFDIFQSRKPIRFVGSSAKALNRLPNAAQDLLGHELERLSRGQDPVHWRPMPSIGVGVREIRVRVGRQFRAIYLTTRPEAIYVLHVFEKKTQQTSGADIDLARIRFRQVLREGTGE